MHDQIETVFCMSCGKQLPASARFCRSCGAAVDDAPSETAREPVGPTVQAQAGPVIAPEPSGDRRRSAVESFARGRQAALERTGPGARRGEESSGAMVLGLIGSAATGAYAVFAFYLSVSSDNQGAGDVLSTLYRRPSDVLSTLALWLVVAAVVGVVSSVPLRRNLLASGGGMLAAALIGTVGVFRSAWIWSEPSYPKILWLVAGIWLVLGGILALARSSPGGAR